MKLYYQYLYNHHILYKNNKIPFPNNITYIIYKQKEYR